MTAQDLVAVMLALVVVDPPGRGEADVARLSRLQRELETRFIAGGVLVFPVGTALPLRDVPDLREDGVLATSNALAMRLHRASAGRFGLAADAVWQRVGKTVSAMPDEYPELLRQLAP